MTINQYMASKPYWHAYSSVKPLPSAKMHHPAWGFCTSLKSCVLPIPKGQKPKEQKGTELTARVPSHTPRASSASSSSSSSVTTQVAKRVLSPEASLKQAQEKEQIAFNTLNQKLQEAASFGSLKRAKASDQAIQQFNGAIEALRNQCPHFKPTLSLGSKTPNHFMGKDENVRLSVEDFLGQPLTPSSSSVSSSSSSSSSSSTSTASVTRLEEARSKEKAANKTYNQDLALAKSNPRPSDQARLRKEATARFNETMAKLEAEYSDVGFTRR